MLSFFRFTFVYFAFYLISAACSLERRLPRALQTSLIDVEPLAYLTTTKKKASERGRRVLFLVVFKRRCWPPLVRLDGEHKNAPFFCRLGGDR